MRVFLACLALLALAPVFGQAAVVRLAPDFPWGKASSLRSLRGQPVVLVMGTSPRSGAFRKQVKNLKALYRQFAGRQTVFIAAFSQHSGSIGSDIPFIVVPDGTRVTAAYNLGRDSFRIAIIGRDGNLDYETTKILSAQRVLDVIDNSFAAQAPTRK